MSKKFSKSRVIIFSIILLILIGFAFIQNKNLITDQTVNNPLSSFNIKEIFLLIKRIKV